MRRRLTSLAVLAAALTVIPAGSALADHNVTHTRQQICTAAGGTFSGPGTATPTVNQQDNQRCTVVTSVDGPPTPSGTPTVTTSEPQPVGEPTSVTETVPVGEPTISERTENVGEPTSTTVDVPGTPTVTQADRDAGPATVVSEDVPSGPPVVQQEIRRGQSVTTTAPGAPINCRRVNNANANQTVERCDRTEIDTTTTQTTVITTTTTPMETVTTTTQPRETVTTTVTPYT
ncbi:hypothetical protein SAMN05660657_04472, partial [Geodermatophilus amargosae]